MNGMQHTLGHLITGEIIFEQPWRFTYVYADGMKAPFEGVRKLQTMLTGCYVLHLQNGQIIVVAPGHRFCIEEPMP